MRHMTLSQAKAMLTIAQIAECEEIGAEWGANEAAAWIEAHDEYGENPKPASSMPEWRFGTWCGDLAPEYGAEEFAETVIDYAAKAAWDASREKGHND